MNGLPHELFKPRSMQKRHLSSEFRTLNRSEINTQPIRIGVLLLTLLFWRQDGMGLLKRLRGYTRTWSISYVLPAAVAFLNGHVLIMRGSDACPSGSSNVTVEIISDANILSWQKGWMNVRLKLFPVPFPPLGISVIEADRRYILYFMKVIQ